MSDRTPSSVRTGSLVGDADAPGETPAGDAKPVSASTHATAGLARSLDSCDELRSAEKPASAAE